jgi:hypothetical protein
MNSLKAATGTLSQEMYHARMTERGPEAIYRFVLDRAGYYTGEPPDEIEDRLLYDDLHIEGWDFADLCDELELRYRVDVKPFFEDGQPTRGWLFWKHKVARDVTVRELAQHVVTLATSVTSVNPDASSKAV